MSNAPQQQAQGQVQAKPVDKLKSIVNTPSVQEQFKNAMGENAGLFTASLIDVFMGDANLQKCDPNEVVMEALKAATLKLPITKSLGQAYIVPYKGKPQMQIGYKGYIQLAQRTGHYRVINADAVYEGELKGHDKLTGTIDLSGTATSNTVIGYFAHIETTQGFQKTSYWTKAQVVEHAKAYSMSYNSKYSPWQTNFHAMAIKTVLKHLLSKYGVMSIEMADAIEKESETQVVQDEEQHANQDVIDIASEDPGGSEEPENEGQGQDIGAPHQDGAESATAPTDEAETIEEPAF